MRLAELLRRLLRRPRLAKVERPGIDPELEAITTRGFTTYAVWRSAEVTLLGGWVKREEGNGPFRIYGVEPRVTLYDTYTFALPKVTKWQVYMAVMVNANVYYVELRDAEKAEKCRITYEYRLDGVKIHGGSGTLWDAYRLETNGTAVALDPGEYRLEYNAKAEGETCGHYELHGEWLLRLN